MNTEAHLKGDMIVFRFPSEKTDNQDLGDAGTRAARKPFSRTLPSFHVSSDYSQSVPLSELQILEREDLMELVLVKCGSFGKITYAKENRAM